MSTAHNRLIALHLPRLVYCCVQCAAHRAVSAAGGADNSCLLRLSTAVAWPAGDSHGTPHQRGTQQHWAASTIAAVVAAAGTKAGCRTSSATGRLAGHEAGRGIASRCSACCSGWTLASSRNQHIQCGTQQQLFLPREQGLMISQSACEGGAQQQLTLEAFAPLLTGSSKLAGQLLQGLAASIQRNC
jgi:hypothetical protein